MSVKINLNDFHVSEKYGFLMEDPLTSLPGTYFAPWENIAKNLHQLLKKRKLRDEVDKMVLLDHTNLEGYKEHALAFTYLSFIGSGYVWQDGDKGVARVLPRQLAIPWVGLAGYFGTVPIINHMTFCLTNSRLIDNSGSLNATNIDVICQFPGGSDFRWFVVLTSEIELQGAPAIKAAVEGVYGVEIQDEATVASSLQTMTCALKNMKLTFTKFHDKLDAEVFFNVFRPYLSGWGGKHTPLPDGLIYEGVSHEPKQMIGGSAAQSSITQLFDIALGISHNKEQQAFLDKMKGYMPSFHRQFLLTLKEAPSIRNFVMSHQDNTKLLEAYNESVTALKDFRSYHIQIVSKYIVQQGRKDSRNKDYDDISQKGTGGTALVPFLRNIRDTTKGKTIMPCASTHSWND